MKNLFLAFVFAVSATTAFSSDISKPIMDPKVVASTIEAVPISFAKGWFIPLFLITILGIASK